MLKKETHSSAKPWDLLTKMGAGRPLAFMKAKAVFPALLMPPPWALASRGSGAKLLPWNCRCQQPKHVQEAGAGVDLEWWSEGRRWKGRRV